MFYFCTLLAHVYIVGNSYDTIHLLFILLANFHMKIQIISTIQKYLLYGNCFPEL